jgi:predicted transcriptional regulator
MPGIEMNIACIILRIEGTIDKSLKVLKILKALKTENGPDAGIKETTTIIKSKTFHPSLKKLNLYT